MQRTIAERSEAVLFWACGHFVPVDSHAGFNSARI
jgi:hypothetical protein